MKITRQVIIDILNKYTKKKEFDDNTDIFEELEIDSLEFVEIIVEFEQLIGGEIPSELLITDYWKNVNTITESINNVLRNPN